jgi:hypothetical protein
MRPGILLRLWHFSTSTNTSVVSELSAPIWKEALLVDYEQALRALTFHLALPVNGSFGEFLNKSSGKIAGERAVRLNDGRQWAVRPNEAVAVFVLFDNG